MLSNSLTPNAERTPERASTHRGCSSKGQAMSEKATVATYAASAGTTLAGTITAQEWATIAGIALGMATFAINWYYKHQHLRVAKALAKLQQSDD